MDLDQIQLENTLADAEHENFVSSHPDQDSLSFASKKALYKVEQAVVECREVPLINVADAEVVLIQDTLLLDVMPRWIHFTMLKYLQIQKLGIITYLMQQINVYRSKQL